MSGAVPSISVVVSARDAESTLGRAIAALMSQQGVPAYEVIVVDNASRDATGELAREAGARVIRLDDRASGPGAARNEGVARARGDVIAFTDADCFPVGHWLAELAAGFESADLVSGPIVPDPEVTRTHWDRTISFDSPSPFFATANLAVRRSDFLAVGGFDDWLGDPTEAPAHPFGEDTVLAWKLLRTGARRHFSRGAVVHHAVFPGTPMQWLGRQAEMQHLPALVKRVPELRRELLLGGVFSSERTLACSIALAGVLAAIGGKRRWPLLTTLPAAWLNARRIRALGVGDASVWALADLILTASVIRGSIRSRTLAL